MYPRGRKVCFATAGFLLIAKTRIYLRSCGIPTGKKRAGLACGIGNILRAGRPSGGQPSFPGRLAGRREAAAKRGTGNAPWRRRKEGRRGGRRCFAGPAGRQNQSRGGGRRPPPLLCARCARPPPGAGLGRARAHALWARAAQNPGGKGRGWARRLGQSRCPYPTGSGGIIRLPRAAGSRELQRTVREYRRARSTAVRAGALTMRLWQELGHKGMEITANL